MVINPNRYQRFSSTEAKQRTEPGGSSPDYGGLALEPCAIRRMDEAPVAVKPTVGWFKEIQRSHVCLGGNRFDVEKQVEKNT